MTHEPDPWLKGWKELEARGSPFLQAAYLRGWADHYDKLGDWEKAKRARDKARELMEVACPTDTKEPD